MAVPPQIAAPADNKKAIRLWIPRSFPRRRPVKKEEITNNEIQGR
jgi:hypothetical protein